MGTIIGGEPVEATVQRESLSITAWMQKLHGLGVLDSLVTIARESDGVLRVAVAKNILIGARVMNGKPKNVPGRLYTLLKERTDLFEQVGSGTYRLIETEPTFVLRGNDKLASDVIARWLQMASARGVNDAKLEAARQALIRFDQWKKESPLTMKLPD